MRKFYLLVLLCTCFSLSLFANGIEIDGINYLLDSTNYTASVTYTGEYPTTNTYHGDIVVPEKVIYNSKDYTVTSVGEQAFWGCTGLTAIITGNSVTEIGHMAFFNCKQLVSVTIPTSVTNIGGQAFEYCTALTSITIPNSVTSIGGSAFYGCTSLISVTIPNSVISIGGSAFYDCTCLTAIDVAYDNPNYSSIDGVLFDKDQTRLIKYPASKTDTEYVIPTSVTSIDGYAFHNCTSLASVTISENVASIGGGVFYGCIGLTSLAMPDGLTSIGSSAFYGCSGLTNITIPNSVTSIGGSAFNGCTSLISITIPNSMTSIGEKAFYDCTCLTAIDVAYDNSNYSSIDGVLFDKNQTKLIKYPTRKSDIEYVIPNSVTSLDNYAFHKCSILTSVAIPNSVTSIGEGTFFGCVGLTSVTIPNSVASIGSSAFYNCTSLISVTISDSVTSIKNATFRACKSLISITIPDNVTNIESFAFCDCINLSSAILSNNIASVGDHAFFNCAKLDNVRCLAIVPPALGSVAFKGINNKSAILYVPKESLETYKAISEYVEYFKQIKIISEVSDITENSANLYWASDSAVIQYNINIYTSDTLFAQYLVDGDGQVISSQRFAPAIYHHQLDTTISSTEYFVISLDGLSAGTDYNYTIDGTNAESAPIYHEEGAFTTLNEGEEGFILPFADDPRKAGKFLRDGLLLIKKNDRTYNAQGVEIQTQNQ